MAEAKSISGKDLREMFTAATGWLEKSAADVDALNVFPVPDGDTGTNMLLTMRSSIEESYQMANNSVSGVAQAIARGALIGARGNSGVILSQIWAGLAQGLDGKDTMNGADLVECLLLASRTAYNGLSNPVEGTILTVMREAAEAAKSHAADVSNDVISVMEATVEAAKESVANTPTLLPVLKESGVVDAGGQGLYTILEGALHYLKGETEQLKLRRPWMIASSIPLTTKVPQMVGAEDEVPYGYCTNFVIKGAKLDPEKLRKRLEKKGLSVIVIGDESAVRVHIHSLDPGDIMHYVNPLGTLHQINIRNMDEQYRDFLEMQKERMPEVDTAIVAVVVGDGLSQVFTSLGTTIIVPGGQTMNPSTKDLLQAVEAVPSEKVIILPNNKNIVLTAEQVPSLTKKKIHVVPTRTIPQGVAALLAFDYEADLETNTVSMYQAHLEVKSIEVTRAVRATRLGGLDIKKNQAIGFLDGDLVAVGDKTDEVLNEVLERVEPDKAEVVTIYYGADTKSAEAEQTAASIRERYPQLQVEVVQGGQPHYNYIASVE
ncbi:MAG: DAK2 domain-containing protein [Deltaproteobacteria bacterium]|nr:DAK2 domain-containing protein [Deltaproteobacteria bacterium]